MNLIQLPNDVAKLIMADVLTPIITIEHISCAMAKITVSSFDTNTILLVNLSVGWCNHCYEYYDVFKYYELDKEISLSSWLSFMLKGRACKMTDASFTVEMNQDICIRTDDAIIKLKNNLAIRTQVCNMVEKYLEFSQSYKL